MRSSKHPHKDFSSVCMVMFELDFQGPFQDQCIQWHCIHENWKEKKTFLQEPMFEGRKISEPSIS